MHLADWLRSSLSPSSSARHTAPAPLAVGPEPCPEPREGPREQGLGDRATPSRDCPALYVTIIQNQAGGGDSPDPHSGPREYGPRPSLQPGARALRPRRPHSTPPRAAAFTPSPRTRAEPRAPSPAAPPHHFTTKSALVAQPCSQPFALLPSPCPGARNTRTSAYQRRSRPFVPSPPRTLPGALAPAGPVSLTAGTQGWTRPPPPIHHPPYLGIWRRSPASARRSSAGRKAVTRLSPGNPPHSSPGGSAPRWQDSTWFTPEVPGDSAAFRFLHPPPPSNSTAKCKALALPPLRPGWPAATSGSCRAASGAAGTPAPAGAGRGGRGSSAHPAGRAGPLPGGGRRGGPCVRARTHPKRAGHRRPPATSVESRESGAGSGKGALRRPPRRTCPTWKTQIPVSNTWETFSPARSAHAPRHPPPGGGPAPTAFTPLTVPGRGAAGCEVGPRGGVACHCRWRARVAEGTAVGPPGQGRPATRNFTRSLALGGGPTGRSRTPAGNGGVVACSSRHAGAGRASRSLPSNGLSREEPPSSGLTAFPPPASAV